jgi:hypothetical protein
VCLGGPLKFQFLPDDRVNAARRRLSQDRRHQRGILRGAQGGAEDDGHVPLPREILGDRREAPAGHAERAEPAALSEEAERRLADIAADPVEHHVHGARGLADLLRPVRRVVVDGDVRPEPRG